MNVKTKLSDCLRPLLLGVALLAATAHAEVRPLDRVVAIVDNDVVMQSQLDARLREVQQTIAKRGSAVPPANVLEQQVLERLIVENLQLQIGERSGIRITDEELNQAVGTIAQRNNMTVEQFRAALSRDGWTELERQVMTEHRWWTPDELRRRNFIPPSAMPYTTALGTTYDSGEFAQNLTDEIFVITSGGRPFLAGPNTNGLPLGDDVILTQNRGRQVFAEISFRF